MSCVRTSSEFGFLHDPHLINVSISRARKGFILIGNKRTLMKIDYWEKVLKHFEGLTIKVPISSQKKTKY